MISRQAYLSFKEDSIQGRYVRNDQVVKFLEDLDACFQVKTEGYSVENRPIQSITLGSGNQKVLMWSQMHGNESTTTKGVLDIVNFLQSKEQLASNILQNCTLKIIPVLNPDGAEAYTRVNANMVDLNRDAQNQSQPESRLLRKVYKAFQPDFCFNLHDQRTIFNVGGTNKPATVSFLAPSHDEERSISKSRGISMQLIVAMNKILQEMIPGQIGRYDDGFNANCVGDTFQMLGTPTILFEAGHFPEDYMRETTREYIFHALVTSLDCIGKGVIQSFNQQEYFNIPENQQLFFDVIVYNTKVINESLGKNIALLYAEVLKDGKVHFEARIEKEGDLSDFFGHHTYNCVNQEDLLKLEKLPFWNLLKP